MTTERQGDYETRDVDYSLIHGETKEVFSRFVSALHLKNDARLLDVGGGYGSVFVNILEHEPQLAFSYDLLDSSLHQIKKAKTHIDNFLKGRQTKAIVNYMHQSAVAMDLPTGHYDVAVCKMFIHEISADKQQQLFKKIFSVIKPGGQLVLWAPDLDQHDHYFYKEVIRKKDELANFNNLAQNRHFLRNAELITLIEEAGFSSAEKLFDFDYDLHTSRRLKSEFNNNTALLKKWNDYILELAGQLSPELKKKLLVDVSENNIHIRFKRAVFKAVKA
jgi:ubiquinone/menaquinone biosynthesis C-methylase UbiE